MSETAAFTVGDRVRVKSTYHWAQGVEGTIAEPPAPVARLVGWSGHHRQVPSREGELTFYWVTFDEGQRDADGAGPYGGAEIDARFLERRTSLGQD